MHSPCRVAGLLVLLCCFWATSALAQDALAVQEVTLERLGMRSAVPEDWLADNDEGEDYRWASGEASIRFESEREELLPSMETLARVAAQRDNPNNWQRDNGQAFLLRDGMRYSIVVEAESLSFQEQVLQAALENISFSDSRTIFVTTARTTMPRTWVAYGDNMLFLDLGDGSAGLIVRHLSNSDTEAAAQASVFWDIDLATLEPEEEQQAGDIVWQVQRGETPWGSHIIVAVSQQEADSVALSLEATAEDIDSLYENVMLPTLATWQP